MAQASCFLINNNGITWHKNDLSITSSFLTRNWPTLPCFSGLLNHLEFVKSYIHWLTAGTVYATPKNPCRHTKYLPSQNSICLSGNMTWKWRSPITTDLSAQWLHRSWQKCWYLCGPLGLRGCFVSSLKSAHRQGVRAVAGAAIFHSQRFERRRRWRAQTVFCHSGALGPTWLSLPKRGLVTAMQQWHHMEQCSWELTRPGYNLS